MSIPKADAEYYFVNLLDKDLCMNYFQLMVWCLLAAKQ